VGVACTSDEDWAVTADELIVLCLDVPDDSRLRQVNRVAVESDAAYLPVILGLAAGQKAVATLEDCHSVRIVQGGALSARGGPKFGRAFGLFAAAQPYSTYSVSRAGIKTCSPLEPSNDQR
jgi:hypothetical protein